MKYVLSPAAFGDLPRCSRSRAKPWDIEFPRRDNITFPAGTWFLIPLGCYTLERRAVDRVTSGAEVFSFEGSLRVTPYLSGFQSPIFLYVGGISAGREIILLGFQVSLES